MCPHGCPIDSPWIANGFLMCVPLDFQCVFHVFEKFIDSDAFDAHQVRTKASDWGIMTKNVERVYEKRFEE